MTMSIFDDEFIQTAHDNRIYREAHEDGVNEGISIGEKKARENARKEILEAKNTITQKMIENGLSDDMIANITGLSVDEVNALKASMTLSGSKA